MIQLTVSKEKQGNVSNNVLKPLQFNSKSAYLRKYCVNQITFLSAPLLDFCRMGNPACVIFFCALGSQHLGTAVCLASSLSPSLKRTDYVLYPGLEFQV